MQLRRTGLLAIAFFPARLLSTIRQSWTSWCWPGRGLSIRAKALMSRITGSAGHLLGFSPRRFPSASKAAGCTEIGEFPKGRGFDGTALTVKDLLYKNELHEVMISADLAWRVGHSGAQGVGANKPDTLSPGIFFAKGFGDAPDTLSWLRPFAVTGAITLEHPMTGTSINFGIDEQTGQLGPMFTRNVDTMHWGFSIQYSTFYLTNRYRAGKLPKDEPLHQFIPLVEFAFDTPRGEKTAATMNSGMAYVGGAWQLAAEAIIPLNSEGGRTIGVRGHLFLFLDDLFPALFGKPVFGR